MHMPDLTNAGWKKSSRSTDLNCVEVAFAGPVVGVRDSKRPEGGVLAFSPARWADFVRSLRRPAAVTRR
ncbi:uncharacterized protein DUF397 [Saccharopolyspora erythraea NRRL 2338]|nr:uncharacterized protein DUF397 [Saccharopolyspora erythraea NRRL 2338]